MPRSRSSSMLSRSWSFFSRSLTAPHFSRMRSAKVVFPWWMCAMIEKLRIRSGGKDIEQPLYHAGLVVVTGLGRVRSERHVDLAGKARAVLVENEIDALADVLRHRHLGARMEELQPGVLLRCDVHGRRELLARHCHGNGT